LRLLALFPHLGGLRLQRVYLTADEVVLEVGARTSGSRCPTCRRRSHHLHSRYVRRIADHPIGGRPFRIYFHVRRFRCGNPKCARRTFVEQHSTLVARSARRSVPLQRYLEDVGLHHGGRPGQRFAERCKIAVNRMTLLRLVRRLPEPPVTTPRVLGIDDFAIKRAYRYGTIVVDLEERRVIDLLPERTASAVAAWITQHGQPDIVCRDRGGDYAAAARQAAPDAVQIADRFHLARNSSEVLERILVRYPAALRAAVAQETPTRDIVAAGETTSSAEESQAEATSTPLDSRQARRRARYDAVVALHQAGETNQAISEKLRLSRPTVRKYVRAGTFPERPARRTPLSAGTRYGTFLQERWAAGERDAAVLWEQLKAQGFSGSLRTVQRVVAGWREETRPRGAAARKARAPASDVLPAMRPPSPRQATWLLLKPDGKLSDEQRAMRTKLLAAAPEVQTALSVIEDFREMLRSRAAEALPAWMGRVDQSPMPELTAFAANLRRDYAAVEAALTYEWSSGQVEGSVTRTKLVKRQGYGRANLDLLRKRALLAA
jgi:transposase